MKRLLVFAVALAVMSGCAPNSGVVYDKGYHSSYTTTDWDCVSYDKKGFCNRRLPRSTYHPEEWWLCLKDDKDAGCRNVDIITWHEYEKGQSYP